MTDATIIRTLADVFRSVLELPETQDMTTVSQRTVGAWDSLGHATLMAAIESEFGLTIDAVDSLELTSFEAARAYVAERCT